MKLSSPTRYANLNRLPARLVPGALAAALVWCLLSALVPRTPGSAPAQQGGKDLEVYRRIVERVHAGESYYDAAGIELRAGGYPTGSLFNWRTPVYAWLIGGLPSPAWARWLLILGALGTMLAAYAAVQREGGTSRAAAAVLLLAGVFLWCVDGDAFLAQELWAGLLIALSICAYALGRRRAGMAAGLGALFFRELALPYCIIALGLAARQKRWREAAGWLCGLLAYAVFLTYHAFQVSARISPGDRLPGSWVQFGSIPFLLATCRMNQFLLVLPLWVSALYLPLSLFGLAGWRGEMGLRCALTACAYVAAFAVLGQPFNDYWGLLYAPLLPFGLVWAPTAVRDLLGSAFRPVVRNPRAGIGLQADAQIASAPLAVVQ
jgi:hypothetical protein